MPLAEVKVLYETSLRDISGSLRNLADQIDAGEHGKAHNLLWVIDHGGGKLSTGLLGESGEPGLTGLFLMRLAEQKFIGEVIAG